MSEGDLGFCGLRRLEAGRIRGGRPQEGNLAFYHDPLPTNCVGCFVCPAASASGYPEYSYARGPEYGYQNLAVFYQACSFNCLYCQNYHFKKHTFSFTPVSAAALARKAHEKTSCICFFGGDPGPQILHAIKAARMAYRNLASGILRICWETNGAMQPPYLKMMADLSLHSGGCIKIDLKAWDEGIHYSLCGVSNRQTLKNFKSLSQITPRRPDPPLLIASTLLVPGYVDEPEVAAIARFIAGLNPDIPYSLLGFYPQFYLDDLPATSKTQALRCKAAAEAEGLRRVHVGNVHLLA
jgi:pyruvate formate lyase activating enzyme